MTVEGAVVALHAESCRCSFRPGCDAHIGLDDPAYCAPHAHVYAAPGQAFVTKDSGTREEWATGSRRDTREGKGRYDLLPPRAIRRLAQLYERGAKKYGDRNWEKGQPIGRYVDSAMRHLFNILEGETTEDHFAAVAWNVLGAIETLERIEAGLLPAELDDRPAQP